MLKSVQRPFLKAALPAAGAAALLAVGLSCADRPASPPSQPPDPPPAADKVDEMMETWASSNGERRIVFDANAARFHEYYGYLTSEKYPFRITAEMHEYKETNEGTVARRLGGKANVLVFDPAGRLLVHEAFSLIDLCPT